jgi:hypothetical protein
MPRRCPLWVVALAAALHLFGVFRAFLPAQDGLKFLRAARQFHERPWIGVVRGTDQHPLYPACIALVEPGFAAILGSGPSTWRIAAQVVSGLASILVLFPLYWIARSLFDDHATASLAVLLFVLLPIPNDVGHDTLADALGLLGFATSLWLGAAALRTGRVWEAFGSALAAGLGYLARPEVAVVPVAVLAVAAVRSTPALLRWNWTTWKSTWPEETALRSFLQMGCLGLTFLVCVGSYALVKGEISEKLAIRRGASIPSAHDAPRKSRPSLPKGLDDARWDFSPKEESDHPRRLTLKRAAARVGQAWVEALGWAGALFAVWGAVRVQASSTRWLIATYIAVYVLALVRHATNLGYLSNRHVLSLVIVSLPWASAGALLCARRAIALVGVDPAARRCLGATGLVVLIAAGVSAQVAKPGHPSRFGHWAAGQWLGEHASDAQTVLDTRGWALFLTGRTEYDYWHVRQALCDPRLAFVIVGAEELSARSRRADTLRAILNLSGERVASFPARQGGRGADVLVYQFHRPKSWEGLRP